MEFVRLFVISSNYYLQQGWITFVNNIQPEILTKTNKFCEVVAIPASDIAEIDKHLTGKCCVLIDKAIILEPAWRRFSVSHLSESVRVFVINEVRTPEASHRFVMPFRPSLNTIKKLIIKAMQNDHFLINDASSFSVNHLPKEWRNFLELLLSGKSIKEIAEISDISVKRAYYLRSKILSDLGISHLNELIRKANGTLVG